MIYRIHRYRYIDPVSNFLFGMTLALVLALAVVALWVATTDATPATGAVICPCECTP